MFNQLFSSLSYAPSSGWSFLSLPILQFWNVLVIRSGFFRVLRTWNYCHSLLFPSLCLSPAPFFPHHPSLQALEKEGMSAETTLPAAVPLNHKIEQNKSNQRTHPLNPKETAGRGNEEFQTLQTHFFKCCLKCTHAQHTGHQHVSTEGSLPENRGIFQHFAKRNRYPCKFLVFKQERIGCRFPVGVAEDLVALCTSYWFIVYSLYFPWDRMDKGSEHTSTSPVYGDSQSPKFPKDNWTF